MAPLSAESLAVLCPGIQEQKKKKKRSFRALPSTHLPPSLYPDGSCVAQPWLSPSLSLSWVKQVFFSTYFIFKPSAFPQTQQSGLRFSLVTVLLPAASPLGIREGRGTGFLFGHFRNVASGCGSVSVQHLLAKVSSPLQPLHERRGCGRASPEHTAVMLSQTGGLVASW